MKEAVTKVIDMLTQEDFHGTFLEVVGTEEQVHYSRRRLLRRGLEFHVCTMNKSAHTKKKSGNLSYAPRIYKRLKNLETLHIRNKHPKLNRINFEFSANVLKFKNECHSNAPV